METSHSDDVIMGEFDDSVRKRKELGRRLRFVDSQVTLRNKIKIEILRNSTAGRFRTAE